MKSLIFALGFFLSLVSSAQYLEATSKPVNFGGIKEVNNAFLQGVIKPLHFSSKDGVDLAYGLSAPVFFGGSTIQLTEQVQSNNVIAAANLVKERAPASTPNTVTSVKEEEIKLPTYYALVIGISDYKNSSQSLSDLDRPVQDAKQLAQTLSEKYNFNSDKLLLLQNPTRGEILDAIDNLSNKITEKDNFLLFYAGHGYWDENLKIGYWLAADASFDKKSTWISNSNIKDYIIGINSKHTLLITDACFSGSIFKTRSSENLSSYGVAKLYSLPSRKAMTSGNLKTVPDQSKFFEYLNKRLFDNQAKYLSARDLFGSLYTAVLNNTSTVPLYGVIQDSGDEGGEFIFIKKD